MKFFLYIAASAILLQSGETMKIELSRNTDSVKKSILEIIPAGTEINTAKSIMEKNGFTCSFMTDASFADSVKIYDHIDFLYCDFRKGFIITRRWQVAIVFRKSLVTDVYATTGLTGP